MMSNIVKFFPLIILLTVSLVSCNTPTSNMDERLNIATIDFEQDLNKLLEQGKYILLKESPLTTSAYYSYDLDSLRYEEIGFTGQHQKNFYQSKPEELNDVFDKEETVNRVDVYTSQAQDKILAICIEVNDKKEAEQLLDKLGKKKENDLEKWIVKDKTYILCKNYWSVDETQMLTLSLAIVSTDARVGDIPLSTMMEDYLSGN